MFRHYNILQHRLRLLLHPGVPMLERQQGRFQQVRGSSVEQDGLVTGLRTIMVKVPASGEVEFRIFKNWTLWLCGMEEFWEFGASKKKVKRYLQLSTPKTGLEFWSSAEPVSICFFTSTKEFKITKSNENKTGIERDTASGCLWCFWWCQFRQENGGNQVIYPGQDKCSRKLQMIYGPLSEETAPKNTWLAEGIPGSYLRIDFFCCRSIRSINWMPARPEAIMWALAVGRVTEKSSLAWQKGKRCGKLHFGNYELDMFFFFFLGHQSTQSTISYLHTL